MVGSKVPMEVEVVVVMDTIVVGGREVGSGCGSKDS